MWILLLFLLSHHLGSIHWGYVDDDYRHTNLGVAVVVATLIIVDEIIGAVVVAIRPTGRR